MGGPPRPLKTLSYIYYQVFCQIFIRGHGLEAEIWQFWTYHCQSWLILDLSLPKLAYFDLSLSKVDTFWIYHCRSWLILDISLSNIPRGWGSVRVSGMRRMRGVRGVGYARPFSSGGQWFWRAWVWVESKLSYTIPYIVLYCIILCNILH